jgi:hypothetical protein
MTGKLWAVFVSATLLSCFSTAATCAEGSAFGPDFRLDRDVVLTTGVSGCDHFAPRARVSVADGRVHVGGIGEGFATSLPANGIVVHRVNTTRGPATFLGNLATGNYQLVPSWPTPCRYQSVPR